MVKVTVETPVLAYIEFSDHAEEESVKKQLTYVNKNAQHILRRTQQNYNWKRSNRESWQRRCDLLKSQIHVPLYWVDSQGRTCIRPGSIPYIKKTELQIDNKVEYPEYKKLAWKNKPDKVLRDEQSESVALLTKEKHAHVQLATAVGKTLVITYLVRETGLPCVVIVPSRSIFREVSSALEKAFGKNLVGALGDGKKRIGKKITVAINKSLSNIRKDTPEWQFFSGIKTMIVDESHTAGTKGMDGVCHDLLANTPYRFFVSATQTRADGTEKRLYSIIGKRVKDFNLEDATKAKYTCPIECRVVDVPSTGNRFNPDSPLEEKRSEFNSNPYIIKFAAKLANLSWEKLNEQTLILVDEISQIAAIVPFIRVPYAYAHGNTGDFKERGLDKCDVTEAVEKFNKGEVNVLIGTGSISTGTNIYPTHNTVNLQGGSSEIKTKQGVMGRSVRQLKGSPYEKYHKPKNKVKLWDFRVIGSKAMIKHLDKRIDFYEQSGIEIKYVGSV